MEPKNYWPIVVALLINITGLSLIYSRLKISPAAKLDLISSNQKYQQILDELASMRNQPQTQTVEPILGSATDSGGLSDLFADPTPNPTPVGYLAITSSQNSQVDVYKESASFSPVIDKIVYGQKYPFTSVLNNWYLITLPSGKTGWVNSQYVKEVSLGK